MYIANTFCFLTLWMEEFVCPGRSAASPKASLECQHIFHLFAMSALTKLHCTGQNTINYYLYLGENVLQIEMLRVKIK